ncbi:MAG: helix-turn-helix domain-containing protein [Pseudonocardiaceae bacterium]
MDVDEASTIGARLRQIRYARRKSLRVVAGLSGISAATLSRIETGQRALDSRSEIFALADALQVAPSELTRQLEPTIGNGEGPAVKAVRRALIAITRNDPAGQVVPVDLLRDRIESVLIDQRRCDHNAVGRELPALIRDMHTSVDAGRDVRELLALGVLLHVQGSHAFLGDMGASDDLRWQTATLAREFAREHGGAEVLGLAAFGAANGLLAAGELDVALAELDSVSLPTTTDTAEQLDGMLALSRSLVAAADKRPADVDAPLDYADELATRTGEGNAYWLAFGPTNTGVWRMGVALEARDFAKAASIAETLQPQRLPTGTRRATYWANYGRALARIRGRQGDAVRALRRAELISPPRVQRHPFVRDVLAEMLVRSRRDATGWELRAMAHRAGLPV